ncbi:MAG TPA: hypothetical protein ENG70_05875 [Candidatus Cloacimonetes bacterium]|nr:hypothetical protein [Candidatus Cloacimonadota bacterium]HEX38359.1 hypothetical protein [Candidatus Cloacimonadota bacterium]
MKLLEKSLELKKANIPFVTATVIQADGSTPAKIGSKILVQSDGTTIGTVGGGNLEKMVIEECLSAFETAANFSKEYDLSDDPEKDSQDTGMICGGSATVFFEVTIPRKKIYIFGGGHVSQALEKIIPHEKYSVIIIDNRSEFASKTLHSNADQCIFADYHSFFDSFTPDAGSFVVIITHGHQHDYEIVKELYKKNPKLKYIGMIGSKKKVMSTVNKLRQELKDPNLSNLYSPVGLDIGGSSPAEIAISIAAEILAVDHGKSVPHMRITQ